MAHKFEPSQIFWEFHDESGISEDEVDRKGDFEWTIGLSYTSFAMHDAFPGHDGTMGQGQKAILEICKSLQETGALPDWCKPEYIHVGGVECYGSNYSDDDDEDDEDDEDEPSLDAGPSTPLSAP